MFSKEKLTICRGNPPWFSRFHNESNLHSEFAVDEMVVNCTKSQQRAAKEKEIINYMISPKIKLKNFNFSQSRFVA